MATVRIEEFIPRRQVEDMLAVTERIHMLDSDLAKQAADNLKRSLVWMKKYLAPTTEFWDWPAQRYQVSEDTHVTVAFIGLGWVIGLERKLPQDASHLPSIEQSLINQLKKLTSAVPTEAQLRLSVAQWTSASLTHLEQSLEGIGAKCRRRGLTLDITLDGASFAFNFEDETLRCDVLDRRTEGTLRSILAQIKLFGAHDFKGADWCAFKRRRLTTIVFAPSEADNFSNLDLQLDVQRLYADSTKPTWSKLVITESGQKTQVGRIGFPQAPFHLGFTHPRLFLELDQEKFETVDLGLVDLETYLSYTWVSHYTRLWEYLVFEDLYTHVDEVRGYRDDADITTNAYYLKYRDLSALRAEIEFLDRLDQGEVKGYLPPRSLVSTTYAIGSAETDEAGILEWLQNRLIPSTVTKLTTDPLKGAIPVLRLEENRLETALSAASQSAGLRMQRTLQALQFAFLLAAAAQLMTLIPIGDALDELVQRTIVGDWLVDLEDRLGLIADLSASMTNIVALAALVFALLKFSNSNVVRRVSDAG